LNDLANQSYTDFEVLVVDGGSIDKTGKECLSFSKKLTLMFFSNNGRNVASQRNLGAKNSHGQFLIFFDADVSIPKNFLKKLHKQITVTKGLLYTTNLSVNSKSQTQILLVELTNFIVGSFNLLGKPFAPGFDIIMDRDIFTKLDGFDPTLVLAEDHDIVQRARKMGILLKVLKEPTLYMSFRRPEKIGYLQFLAQYAISGTQTLLGEPIRKELYKYPMGGHVYDKTGGNGKNILTNITKSLSTKIKSFSKNLELPF